MKLNSDAEKSPYSKGGKSSIVEGDNIPVEPLPYPPMQLEELMGYELASEMTKREAVACAALQGLCADSKTGNLKPSQLASAAVLYADALIAELQK